MSTHTARSGSNGKATKTGLVPVLDDAAWFARHRVKKTPPVPVVTLPEPPRPPVNPTVPAENRVAVRAPTLEELDAVLASLPPRLKVKNPSVEELLQHFREVYLMDAPPEVPKTDSKREARRLVAAVAAQNGIKYHEIIGPSRQAVIVKARRAAMALVAQRFPGWSLPMLGRFFERDHTTILHNLRKAGVRQ